MEISDVDTKRSDSEGLYGPGPIPGDELYMIRASVLYILCSVSHSSTQWIASPVAVALDDWR